MTTQIQSLYVYSQSNLNITTSFDGYDRGSLTAGTHLLPPGIYRVPSGAAVTPVSVNNGDYEVQALSVDDHKHPVPPPPPRAVTTFGVPETTINAFMSGQGARSSLAD